MIIKIKDMKPYMEANKKEKEKLNNKIENMRYNELEQKGLHIIQGNELREYSSPVEFDNPNSLNNYRATVLYISVMLGSLIFNDYWLIWIISTAIFLKFIIRHKNKK